MKHASLKRFLSLFLALVMVVGIIPTNLFHAHATEAENPAVVVEDGGNVVINDSSNVVVNAPTKGVTNENTRVEIDYNYQQYQTDKDGKLIYDQNGKPIPVTAMNALSFESEKNRELSYTYPNSTKPLDFDYYWSSSNKTKWNQVYKGDYTRDGGKLRELLESTDPDHKYIVLMEDIKCTVDFGKDYDPIIITGEKVLDLNGHTLELYDKRNGTKDQDGPMDAYTSYMFEIKGTGETQGNQGRLGGALLTILDSAGSNIIYTDPKGETGPYYSDRVGKIYANAYMINHQKWDFWYYTHRDIFLVTGGDLVIYGGEFQAGRQQDQYKTGFSWSALKEVIGQTVALGSSIFEYASGISAATAAKQDKMQEIYPQGQKETSDSDNGQAKDKGTTGKKTGSGGTEEKKTETPATAGTAANPEAKKDQTVAQKQNDQNKKEDENKKGDKGTENKKDDKKAAKNDKNTQIDTLNKNIAKAALDKDKILDMVDSAIELGEGIYDLFAKDNNTRCTACIQGTVARLGNECTMVIYGGTFIGHGSTPNVRNAVIETAYNTAQVTNVESDPRYGKTRGGWVYVYDGVFEAYTGANVFNMYENAYNQKMDTYKVDENGNVTTETIKLLDCETYGIKEVRYKNYDKWLKSYNAMSDAQKEKADGPELANTANISIRGGTFRCYYEYSNMAVMDSTTRGTDKSEGQYCPKCDKYGDDCDDWEYHRFNGTPGSVNLGVESYDEDLIKDGRIQLVDVYGQGKLVLLDGGEPIEEKPEPDKINPATGLPYTDSELRDLDPDTGVAVEAPKTNYQTEGNFRHYRLYIGDQQLRSLSYLTVYPNTSITNSTFSFALETYWGTGTKTDLEWKSDDENIRAPYSSNEKFFDFEFDDTDTSSANSGGAAGVYIIPQLNIPNALTAGEELHTSNVWYYNVPVNCHGETLGNVEVSDTYLETDSSVNGEKFVASFNKTKKSGEVYTDKFAWSLNDFKSWGGTYYNQTDANYKTNIKFFTYKIYRVDPLSRENINESDTWSDNEPLLEVRYGTGTDSLRCKLTLVKLEEQIRKAMAEKHPEENWTGFSSGELYRVVFTVEEQIGFGYMGTQYDGEVKYLGKLNTASSQSSILFRCVSVNEYKEGTHENTTNGTSVIGRVPDWTPLQFRGDVAPGEYANVELVNGQTALVDWQGVRVFDIYYQWYVLDDPEDTTPTLIGGTDNVWVAQNSAGGKKNHKPRNFILKNDGSGVGINDELYANTVDPNSPEATMYEYGLNGLPKDSRQWNGEMLHMYTYETCPDDPGMRKDPNDDLYMANNYTFWGNTDSLYIPAQYAGKYLQVKVKAVNVRYPHLYDNLQTIASHIVPISGIPHPGFETLTPAPEFDYTLGGNTNLGKFFPEDAPEFSFTANGLSKEFTDQGYYLKLTTEDYVGNELVHTSQDGASYRPTEYGDHRLVQIITIMSSGGQSLNSMTFTYTFTIKYRPKVVAAAYEVSKSGVTTKTALSAEQIASGYAKLGDFTESVSIVLTPEPLPKAMSDAGYALKYTYMDRVDGQLVESRTTTSNSYWPNSVGNHVIEARINCTSPEGEVVSYYTFTVALNLNLGMEMLYMKPVEPTEEERIAGVTNLGEISLKNFKFSYTPPAWVLRSYKIEAGFTDKLNGVSQSIPVSRTVYYQNISDIHGTVTLSASPRSMGDHEVTMYLRVKDESGKLLLNQEHTYIFTYLEEPPYSIEVQKTWETTELYLTPNATHQLKWVVTPTNASQSAGGFESSNPEAVTVSSTGVVKGGVRPGQAYITVYAKGRAASTQIKVTNDSDKCSLIIGGIGLYEGEYLQRGSSIPTKTKPADNYVYLSRVNGVLTLTMHNYTVEDGWFRHYDSLNNNYTYPRVLAKENINIVLEGQNALLRSSCVASRGFLRANGGTFSGSGSLLIDGYGIESINGSVEFKTGTITIQDASTGLSIGDGDVSGEDVLNFTGGTLNISASSPIVTSMIQTVNMKGTTIRCESTSSYSSAMQLIGTKNVNITAGTVEAKGTKRGIEFSGTLSITGGNSSFIGGYNGIYMSGCNMKVTGGTLYVEGGNSGILAYTVWGTPEVFSITGGNVLIKSTNTTADSSYCALEISDNITRNITVSTLLAAENSVGAGYVTADLTKLSSYDFLFFGSDPLAFAVELGGKYLFEGTYMEYGSNKVKETTDAVKSQSYVAYYEGDTLYMREFMHYNPALKLPSKDFTIHVTDDCYLDQITGRSSYTLTIEGPGSLDVGLSDQNIGIASVRVLNVDTYVFVRAASICISQCSTLRIRPNGDLHLYGTADNSDGVTGIRYWDASIIMGGGTLTSHGTTETHNIGSVTFTANNDNIMVGSKSYNLTLWDGTTDLNTYSYLKVEHVHSMTHYAATSATCIADGTTGHYTCSICNRSYMDANGTTEITDMSQVVTSATGHNWKSATCYTPKTCQNCGLTDGNPRSHYWVDPTCTEPRTCRYCKETQGDPIGHVLVNDYGITQAPTCSTEGIHSRSCNRCGTLVKEPVPVDPNAHQFSTASDCENPAQCVLCGVYDGYPMGHKWEDATCDTPKTCETCGKTEGSALGHEWVEASCTDPKHCMNCTASEGTALAHTWIDATCTTPKVCTSCGLKDGKSLGHSIPSYTHTADSHIGTCSTCGETLMEAHVFENGACIICGRAEQAAPVLDSAIKFNHTLNLASDISANFVIAKSLLTGYDMTTAYVEFEIDTYSGNEKTGTKSTKATGVLNGNYYYFTFNGLNATMMNDDIRATFYGTKDGAMYKSNVDVYSVATYAYSSLDNPGRPESLKVLCANLLRYGANAQSYKSYRTNALADSKMTDAHKTYLTALDSVVFDTINKANNDLENPAVSIVGKSLNLDSKVTLKFIAELKTYEGNVEDLSVIVTYTDIKGVTKSATLTDPQVYDLANNRYSFEFDGLLAAELRQPLTVAVYSDSTRLSGTIEYSASTYGTGKQGALKTLCQALMAYSDAAKAYFVG